jgi:hypothetical protein
LPLEWEIERRIAGDADNAKLHLTSDSDDVVRNVATPSRDVLLGVDVGIGICKADGEGFDADSVTGNLTNDLRNSDDVRAAESGAVCPDVATLPTDLAQIVSAWPTLPAPIRRAMLALIG